MTVHPDEDAKRTAGRQGSAGRWREFASACQLIGEALQPVAVIAGIIVGVATYTHSVANDKEASRLAADARERELSHAYYEKQLELYLDAARVAAHLAAVPGDAERDKLVARFWELYWGELAFVESRVRPGDAGGPHAGKSIESLMVTICHDYVSPDDKTKCHAEGNESLQAAIGLAHEASDQVQAHWLRAAPAR